MSIKRVEVPIEYKESFKRSDVFIESSELVKQIVCVALNYLITIRSA